MSSPSTREQIHAILIHDWDPCDAARAEAAHNTYDGYIAPLAELLARENTDEDAIIAFLKEREGEIMCFPAAGTTHLQRVARKLLGLRENKTAQ